MNRFFTLLLAASCLTAVGQVPDYVPTDGLVVWYPFNGSADDESGAGMHSTTFDVDLVENRLGTPNSAYQFSGSDSSFIVVPDMPSPQEFTLSVWCSKEVDSNVDSWIYGDWLGSAPVFGDAEYQGGIGLLIRTDNLIYAHVDSVVTGSNSNNSEVNGYCSSSDSIGIGSWEHVVLSRSNGQASFWLNGELSATAIDYSENPTDREAPARIGASANDTQRFQGSIDDFGFWSRALSEAEILSLFYANDVGGCTDVTACNYNPDAELDDGTCASCEALATACGEGTVWDTTTSTCIVANPADINLDGCVQLNDLLDLLSAYGDCGAEESPWQCGDPLEYQGYGYETVQIGEQCWFAENLRAQSLNNGDDLNEISLEGTWESTTIPSVGSMANCQEFYGSHYNWLAVFTNGLCPSNWHVPSKSDWESIFNEVPQSVAGAHLKSDQGWNGLNSYGFSVLPAGQHLGGFCGNQGYDGDLSGSDAFFWTSTESGGTQAWQVTISGEAPLYMYSHNHSNAYSIRCIKDTE